MPVNCPSCGSPEQDSTGCFETYKRTVRKYFEGWDQEIVDQVRCAKCGLVRDEIYREVLSISLPDVKHVTENEDQDSEIG